MEIHDDKLKLVRKGWSKLFSPKNEVLEWSLSELAQFQISSPKVVWGKLEWSSFDGHKGTFRFTTNAQMVSKIEKYLHKLILKNLNRRKNENVHPDTHLKLYMMSETARAA
jgi:hypothetical protein